MLARWIPWVLMVGALGLFLAISPSGAALAVAWLIVILLERGIVLSLGSTSARVTAGILFVVLCFLAAFEGGWYVIPSAVAFLIVDGRREAHGNVLRGRRLEVAAGVGSAIAGWSALALIVWGPLYSARTSTIGQNGGIDSAVHALSLAAVGITDRAAIVLIIAALLLAVVAAGALIHARLSLAWGRWAIGLASLGLGGVVALGLPSIGPWLLPALILAILAWWAGRGDPLSARRGHRSG